MALPEMNEPNPNPDDARLRALLREARETASLPARFQEGVWRKIELAEGHARNSMDAGWLDALAAWVLSPRWALGFAALLILGGILLGVQAGTEAARADAQARYLATVAPDLLR